MHRLLRIRRLSTSTVPLKGLPLSFKVASENPTNPDLPPILVLHGFLSTKEEWMGLAKTLSNLTKRSVAVADLRNHGISPRSPKHSYEDLGADLLLLMDKLVLKKATLVGHCMGGRAAMALALIAPQRIHSLVIVDTSPVSPCQDMQVHFPPILKAMRNVDFSGESRPRLHGARKRARKTLGPLIHDDFLMNTVLSNINVSEANTKWLCNLDALEQNLPRLVFFPPELRTRACDAQTLFIGGQRSEHLPADDLPGIRACFPAAAVNYVPKTGHYPHHEEPARFLELAIEFLLNDSAL